VLGHRRGLVPPQLEGRQPLGLSIPRAASGGGGGGVGQLSVGGAVGGGVGLRGGGPACAARAPSPGGALPGVPPVRSTGFAVVRVGNVQLAVGVRHPECVLEAGLLEFANERVLDAAGAVAIAEDEEPAADERLHFALAVERHLAESADFAIGHEDGLAVGG